MLPRKICSRTGKRLRPDRFGQLLSKFEDVDGHRDRRNEKASDDLGGIEEGFLQTLPGWIGRQARNPVFGGTGPRMMPHSAAYCSMS